MTNEMESGESNDMKTISMKSLVRSLSFAIHWSRYESLVSYELDVHH